MIRIVIKDNRGRIYTAIYNEPDWHRLQPHQQQEEIDRLVEIEAAKRGITGIKWAKAQEVRK